MSHHPPNRDPDLVRLEAYARQRLAAERYPEATHRFRPLTCPHCGVAPLALVIEHHTGSRPGNHRGVIWATCARCGQRAQIYGFTGSHRQLEREEEPACACGHRAFYVGECERIEGDEGIPGFVDEGVVVAQCARCGRPRELVAYD